jgi:hypothetical protein
MLITKSFNNLVFKILVCNQEHLVSKNFTTSFSNYRYCLLFFSSFPAVKVQKQEPGPADGFGNKSLFPLKKS